MEWILDEYYKKKLEAQKPIKYKTAKIDIKKKIMIVLLKL